MLYNINFKTDVKIFDVFVSRNSLLFESKLSNTIFHSTQHLTKLPVYSLKLKPRRHQNDNSRGSKD